MGDEFESLEEYEKQEKDRTFRLSWKGKKEPSKKMSFFLVPLFHVLN